MIVKFDHITYIESRENYTDFENFENDSMKFKEIYLKNPKGKRKFMYYEQEDSDLYFYEGSVPKEVVLYDKVQLPSEITFYGDIIYAKFKGNADSIVDLLSIIFRKKVEKTSEREIICNVSGVFDKCNYYIYFEKDEKFEPAYLDRRGWNCPCFLVDSLSSFFDQISHVNCNLSSVDKIIVNNRKLEIAFLRSDELNIIFEFISPCH